MRKRSLFLILFLALTLLVTFIYSDQQFLRKRPDSNRQTEMMVTPRILNDGQLWRPRSFSAKTDHLLVKFKPHLSSQLIATTLDSYQVREYKRIPRLNIYRVKVPQNLSVEEAIQVFQQNPDVLYVEPDYKARIAITPNDTFFKYQYALYNSGQEIGIPGSPRGKSRADIRATESWEETKGKEDVVIAIIDTGIDFEHPDLNDKIHSTGYDFANDDNDPTDDHGHGTHVAGIAAAETNNEEGIAGVAWNCKILPLKVMDANGEGYYSWMIDAIVYATDNGADVINFSLGGDQPSQALKEALVYAYERDVVVVAAAGNENSAVLYPAAYDDYCLAVTASDYNDLRPDWTNHGPEIDVAAPGVRILSCVPTWYWGPDSLPYGYGYGTSMAAPHVSGLVALIKSIKPWLHVDEIMDIIRFTADDINARDYPGKDDFVGYGRINMEKALVPIIIR
jgi:subtilisin family serine protease